MLRNLLPVIEPASPIIHADGHKLYDKRTKQKGNKSSFCELSYDAKHFVREYCVGRMSYNDAQMSDVTAYFSSSPEGYAAYLELLDVEKTDGVFFEILKGEFEGICQRATNA